MPSHSQIEPRIRAATTADIHSLARIYNHYVEKTVVTFEEEPVSPSAMTQRILEAESATLPWLAAEQDGCVVGYAFASKWKDRCAYRFSAEVTVYIDPCHLGRGCGSKLYSQLIPRLEARGIHTIIAGIALPNEASVAFHESCSFRKAAHFKEVGFKFGQWIDVGYWQRAV